MNINRIFSILFIFCLCAGTVQAQLTDVNTVRSYQMSMPRVSAAFSKYDNILRSEFKNKGLNYPANNIYIRSFKAQNELEVWVKNNNADTFSLFKKYKVCALSGVLGPKRAEGDRQVPEGLYFLADFNPKSDFYLSMLVNYPNYSDKILSHQEKPGGDIYMHGGCLTVGCIPMTDEGIQEIYTLCLSTRLNGQTNIPYHIFPTRFDKAGLNFLGREYRHEVDKQKFWVNLKSAYDYFERNKNILPVMYDEQGRYVF
ncbi:murein L,D-transpeptidase family protein [Taibaiella sp. KBW10]|uniref:L,D-transpeptidase family protein n=1 Tax=Taibaiella sp. KBW10 TaxID=2153357 RepID=UPI000F592D6C|nr:L,D-transpeptidase family protein [Taibaiella sp. KBW10]